MSNEILRMLASQGDMQEETVESLTLVSFEPDPMQQEERVMAGQLTVDVKLKPGVKSPYQAGVNKRYVLISRVQGIWQVEKLGSNPFTLDEDAPVGTRDYASGAQKLEGVAVKAVVEKVDMGNGVKTDVLQMVSLKIEKNHTAGGKFRAGQTVDVYMTVQLPNEHVEIKDGSRMILYTNQADPRVTMGETTWYGRKEGLFVLKNGKAYNVEGQAVVSTELKKE